MPLQMVPSYVGIVGVALPALDNGGLTVSTEVPAFVPLSVGGYPIGLDGMASVPIGATSGNVANAVASATLAAAAGKTTYITGFDITGAGATAGAVVVATVTGLKGGTQSFVVTVATGATVGNPPVNGNFNPGFPASAVNTAIVVSCPALGAGNTNNVVNVRGFQS